MRTTPVHTKTLRDLVTRISVMGLLLASLACQTRDHDNPFDPENPSTLGRPPLLEAVASNQAVDLSWRIESVDDVQQVRILRTGGQETDRTLLTQDGVGDGFFVDRDLDNDVTYSYRLEVRAPNDAWLPSSPDLATPGTAQPWVGDAVGAGLRRLSPDGRDIVVAGAGGGDVLDIFPNADGSVWCADFGLGRVLHFSDRGALIDGWSEPGANTLAVDQASGEVWVGSFSQETLSRYSTSGSLRFRLIDVGLIEDVDAEPDPTNGGIWYASRFSGVRFFQGTVQVGRWDDFSWPVALSRSSRGWVWVIDRAEQRVSRIMVGTAEVMHSDVEFSDPRDGSLHDDGGFWVADPGRNGVVLLDESGRETRFLEIGRVTAVTWDPVGRRLWAVFREARRISAFDETGQELSRVDAGNSPVKVEGNW